VVCDRGIRIVFDPAIDAGVWPGAVGAAAAVCGEAWLGPVGLLGRLEVELGLGGVVVDSMLRCAVLARRLVGRDGFWSGSFARDPVGTGRRLLGDRDELAMWGWRGEAASGRLRELWDACEGAAPGVPDRLRDVVEALATRGVDIDVIRVVEPVEMLPPLCRAVFAGLARGGVRIEEAAVERAAAAGDLARARDAGFVPVGDGSVVLLRPHGVLAAADEVAGMLAAMGSLEGVVVVTPDGVLDDALGRHGVPRAGGAREAGASVGLVRLVLECAFAPMDPMQLHDLLCAEPGPVPRGVGWWLARVLASLPGRGGAAWNAALAEGLARLDDDDRRERVARRLDELLRPVVDRAGFLSPEQVRARLRALTGWALGRVDAEPGLALVVAMAEGVLEVIERLGLERVGRAELRRLCDELDGRHVAGAAEAGLASVADPGAMLGPAQHIVWWNFVREAAPWPRRVRLSDAERAGLRAAGVEAPDAGAVMAGEARRWRRPLVAAGRSLVLVCPQVSEAGEAAHPHPLWDELLASMVDVRQASRLVVRGLSFPVVARRRTVELRLRVRPAERASAGRGLGPRGLESPSSVEQLLGCSLAWALRYHGELRPGIGCGPAPPSPLLYGTIAHHFLDLVFRGGALAPDEAARRAEELVEGELGAVCESLELPDHQAERAMVKVAVVESARRLAMLVAETGASIVGTEHRVERAVGAVTLQGKIDLLLGGPDVVVDLKWGLTTNRRRLESGTALQLAAYAELVRGAAGRPAVAYFILNSQQLLAEPGAGLPDAQHPGGFTADAMWAGAMRALAARLGELAGGELVAPAAAGGEPGESSLGAGGLMVAPPCRYCEHGVLCGRRGAR
jgi:hypothetical protein